MCFICDAGSESAGSLDKKLKSLFPLGSFFESSGWAISSDLSFGPESIELEGNIGKIAKPQTS